MKENVSTSDNVEVNVTKAFNATPEEYRWENPKDEGILNLILKRLNKIETSIKHMNVLKTLSPEVKSFMKETIRRQMMFNGTEGTVAKKLADDIMYIIEAKYENN